MDAQQTLRMIEWLDEERRRDKNMIARLEERLNQQQELIEKLLRQHNGLENEQISMRSQFIPAERDGQLVEQMRNEMRQLIESVETKRLNSEREAERRHEISRENLTRPIRELNERMDKMEGQVESAGAFRAERDRISTTVLALQQRLDDLAKKIDGPERRIVALEEQRRQDNRRISDVQSEIPELSKLIEGLKLKIERLEALSLANESRVLEMQNFERNRREELQNFIDQQNLFMQQRDQEIKEMTRNIGAYDEDIRRNLERFESWSETHRQMKKLVDDFERIGERLERRINEVSEMQRLSEERFREEWNEWTVDDQRRWKQFTLSNDEAWRKHEKELTEFRKFLDVGREELTPLAKSVERLWRLEQARSRFYIEGYQNLMMQFDIAAPSSITSSAPMIPGTDKNTNGNG